MRYDNYKSKADSFVNKVLYDRKLRYYYLAYSILFILLTFLCFTWFILSGRSFIWQEDGWTQHFKALVYYAKYLRNIIRHLIYDHKLVIQDWNFYIGEGSDIVNALHYYAIGDPIALLSVFVPTKYMHYFYSFACILRLYLAGVAFSALCFGTNIRNRIGVMAAAFSYCFCEWAILCVARHPFFLNPLIYFPLMILGIEKVIRKEKPFLFILTSTVSAASNFYFFYMIVILAVSYALIRLGTLYRKSIKKGLQVLLRLGIYAVIGVSIAGIIVLPVLMMFLSDSRLGVSQPFHWLYPMSYYSQLPGIAISSKTSYWLCLGLTAPAVLSVFLLFVQKGKDTLLKLLIIICLGIIVFPIAGRVLNGMSYMTNRWCWAFVLICSYTLAREWDDLILLSESQWKYLLICSMVYYAACLLLDKSRDAGALSVIPLFFLTLIILKWAECPTKGSTYFRNICLLGIVAICIINNSFWQHSPGGHNYAKECKEYRKIREEWSDDEATVMKKIIGTDYVRYSGNDITQNANMIHEVSNTQYNWSISNPSESEFRKELNFINPWDFNYEGYDNRTTPLALSSVQYFVVDNQNHTRIPFGYEKLDSFRSNSNLNKQVKLLKEELHTEELTDAQIEKLTENSKNYVIYKNKYPISIGYFYDSYITDELWNNLDPVQKQEIMLDAAYIQNKNQTRTISSCRIKMPDYTIPYTIKCVGNEISLTESGIITTAENTQVKLILANEICNSEIYVGFEGLSFTAVPRYDLYFGSADVDPLELYNRTNWDMLTRDQQILFRKEKLYWDSIVNPTINVQTSAGSKNSIEYNQPDAACSSGRHDYIANLGYSEKPVTSITITFPKRGMYSIESLKVYSIGMENYENKITKLQNHQLHNIEIGIDQIKGTADLDKSRILCVAVPYSTGWRGYIDESESIVFPVNAHYLGMVVPEGQHTIYFKYSMPYKTEGVIISSIGLVTFMMLIIMNLKNKTHSLNKRI